MEKKLQYNHVNDECVFFQGQANQLKTALERDISLIQQRDSKLNGMKQKDKDQFQKNH